MRARKLGTQPQPSRAPAASEVDRDEGNTALRHFRINRAEGAGFVVVLGLGGEATHTVRTYRWRSSAAKWRAPGAADDGAGAVVARVDG